MALSCIISDLKRDICRKSRFSHTPAFDAAVGVMGSRSPSEYWHIVWYEETKMVVWLPDDDEKIG